VKRIKIYPAPASTAKRCKEPLKAVAAAQILALDPNGARTRLFAKDNPDAVHVGDIVLVRQRDGDPFSGVVMVIRRAGADTGILLRAQLTRVGVEMWFKIYSPTVTGIEIVQRTRKRKRRARLFYLRYVSKILQTTFVIWPANVIFSENRSTTLDLWKGLFVNTSNRERCWGLQPGEEIRELRGSEREQRRERNKQEHDLASQGVCI
jgi:ribosomal protein L19